MGNSFRREDWDIFGVFLKVNKPILRQLPVAVGMEVSLLI